MFCDIRISKENRRLDPSLVPGFNTQTSENFEIEGIENEYQKQKKIKVLFNTKLMAKINSF